MQGLHLGSGLGKNAEKNNDKTLIPDLSSLWPGENFAFSSYICLQ